MSNVSLHWSLTAAIFDVISLFTYTSSNSNNNIQFYYRRKCCQPLKQKGSPQHFYTYRSILIGSIMAKVLMNILLIRLLPL